MGFTAIIASSRVRRQTETMHLSYAPTTELDLLIVTQSGDDWEIDWGDGVWEQYPSSGGYQTKTFSSSTSGVASVRSATGRELDDLHRVQSSEGTWNFDISALSNVTYYVRFEGALMEITYSSTAWNTVPNNRVFINIATGRLSTAEIDKLLSDLDTVGSYGTATIDLRRSNQPPTPSGVTAADNLMARGYTVLTN